MNWKRIEINSRCFKARTEILLSETCKSSAKIFVYKILLQYMYILDREDMVV